jgi:hypothetical protein
MFVHVYRTRPYPITYCKSTHIVCASSQVRQWLAADLEELGAWVCQEGAAQDPEAVRQLAAEGVVECFAMARCARGETSAGALCVAQSAVGPC